jgi:integrase
MSPGPAKKPARVLGPYEVERNGVTVWRLVTVDGQGRRSPCEVGSQEDAVTLKAELETGLAKVAGLTVEQAIVAFKQRRLLPNQRKGSLGAETKVIRLQDFFRPVLKRALLGLTPKGCEALYLGRYDEKTGEQLEPGLIGRHTRFGRPPAPATHHACLYAAQDFAAWCVKNGLLPKDPVAHVEPIGDKNAQKKKLNTDQANRFMEVSAELIRAGDVGAVAALLAIMTGLRASEVTSLTPSSIDSGATVVRIWRGKSKRAERALAIPVDYELGALLSLSLRSLVSGKRAEDWVFPAEGGGQHSKDWLRDQTRRICTAARVPVISAQGLRGTHLTMAEEAGTSPEMMLRSGGHESRGVQTSAYLAPGATERGLQKRFLSKLKVLAGGAPAADQWRVRGVKVGGEK